MDTARADSPVLLNLHMSLLEGEFFLVTINLIMNTDREQVDAKTSERRNGTLIIQSGLTGWSCLLSDCLVFPDETEY